MAHEEKREFPRMPADIVITLEKASSERVDERLKDGQPSTVKNVSQGGLYIETDMQLSTSDVVALEIRMPSEEVSRVVLAAVRWVDPADPHGVGLEFLDDYRDSLREAILEYIESMTV